MKTLTEKQQSFCNEYVANGYNGSKAYATAYEQKNKDICKAEAYKLLRSPNIQEGIKNVELDYRITGHGLGINRKAILKVIKNGLTATKINKYGDAEDDTTAQLKAVEVYAKLVGDFSPDKKSIIWDDSNNEVDLSKLTPEERKAYKAKIIAEL